ncbi:MAG: amidohydrolase, partial [Halobacteriaceae archaeon]
MSAQADLVLKNARVHPLTGSGEVPDGVAISDGEILRVDSNYELDFLVDVETTVIDCEGMVVLPGFIDAHTHLQKIGQYQVHADLRDASGPSEAVELLQARAESCSGWVQGYGFDESTWDVKRYLTRDDLDEVSTERPVVAFREDGHTASINTVALDELDLPRDDVSREDGRPTGVIVEDAVEVVSRELAPDRAQTRELLTAARDRAHRLGITGIHDMVRKSHAPEVYRELDKQGQLNLRVRLNYWSNHLDAVIETGLQTNHGSDFVEMGGIKSFTDGSFGGRTAKLSEPYADDPNERGKWVVSPGELEDLVERADAANLQVTIHAIGDEAIGVALDALESTDDPETS